jgi:putative tryptophan/tyrosine transport system substrate-binding protein
VKRREFISLIGGMAATWPSMARAQQSRQMRTVGVFSGMSNEGQGQLYFKAFREGLQSHGWKEGGNVRFVYRWAVGDRGDVRALAAEMVGAKPDVILAMTVPALTALSQSTDKIPIVFGNVSDPVEGGFVKSIARPGGNITGFTSFEYSMGGKWLELLKETAPAIKRALVILDPENYTSRGLLRVIEAASASIGARVVAAPVRGAAEVEASIVAFARESGGGIILLPSPAVQTNLRQIIDLAVTHRLPTLYQTRTFPDAGGLMSYGTDFPDLYRRAAGYADRILKGDNVADLPVQYPMKYELVINLKTAQAIGLDVPPIMLTRADVVIE